MILSTALWHTGIFTYPILVVIKKDGLDTWLFLPLPEGQDSYKDTQLPLQYSLSQ